MPTFTSYDGTELAYHLIGDGDPIVCIPGGPMQASAYLGDLGGGLANQLVKLDLRGTGDSATPADPTSYQVERQVADLEVLRNHLGLDQLDLLAHSAGTNLAALYLAAHPDRVRRYAAISPSAFAVGLTITAEQRLETARQRASEPWFADAYAALEQITSGTFTDDLWQAIRPFSHGRWDAAAQALEAATPAQQNEKAAAIYASELTPSTSCLTDFTNPVLVVSGQTDVGTPPAFATAYAALFPHATLTIQPASGHFPWLDDPAAFAATVDDFFTPAHRAAHHEPGRQ
ncbi:alpha/beta fold hydrolase [Kribbella italica]|uniref:Pimeloyl-ACP methyl ester carboxylesterase n=1 Tax=Kribbella italica TaxID=1540520 RepID=A0A7W9JBH9_9ACTN|nr:alpha/beta hydrolase [Kribbella italica]MBB5838690.1 pimeloyl-ACP methyl ester carboxylesterase [Kribbella italica]